MAAGLFLNTIPSGSPTVHSTWLDAVEHVFNFERTSHRHRRYPLQAMQSDAGRPLFNHCIRSTSTTTCSGRLPVTIGVELLGFDAHERTNFALWVTAAVQPQTGRLSLRVSGDPDGAHSPAGKRIRELVRASAGGHRADTRRR